jgi:methionyl aminopeptidase
LTELEENQLIAIEPFATNGHGMVFESANPTLFSLSNIRPVRSPYAREVLTEIKNFDKLPFTTRWLTRKINPRKVRLALTELRTYGVLHEYPPLIESKKGIVSQTEHTVIVREKPIITTARDE